MRNTFTLERDILKHIVARVLEELHEHLGRDLQRAEGGLALGHPSLVRERVGAPLLENANDLLLHLLLNGKVHQRDRQLTLREVEVAEALAAGHPPAGQYPQRYLVGMDSTNLHIIHIDSLFAYYFLFSHNVFANV